MKSEVFRSKRATCLYALTGCLLLIVILANIEITAEYVFARGLTRAINFLLSKTMGVLPFSLYEFAAVLLILCGIVLVAFIIVLLCKKQFKRALTYIFRIAVCALSTVLFFFVTYGALYHRQTLAHALDFRKTTVTEENLYAATDAYIDTLLAADRQLNRYENGDIIIPHSFETLGEMIGAELDKYVGKYLNPFGINPKKVLMSDVMSYLMITGIYFPFTAEANINTNASSFELAHIMAHEMAHARGVARENEANLLAYYALLKSEDAYLRYSASMLASLNLLSAVRKTNEEQYQFLRARLPDTVNRELQNDTARYANFDSFIGDISRFFNHLFLKSNGISGGTKSYGETTEYLVADFAGIFSA